MMDKYAKGVSWNFFSGIIITGLLALQFARWFVLPHFMDIYYHLLTAQGFIQAGGYSGWDFWQYAPVGRPHIYPPFFHLALAGLMQAGLSPVILAKLCEALIPVILLAVLWKFIKDNYSQQLAFFVVLLFFSSVSFYLSLLSHIPASLAFIFGILSLSQLFKKRLLRSAILLSLVFYTHIGISLFFALTFLIYGLLNKELRKRAIGVLITALILALPIIIKELSVFKFIRTFGFSLHEKYLCQIKILESILALIGLFQALKKGREYRLFAAIFLASLIFIIYPYRFLSAEGYFPVILLGAFCLSNLYQKINRRYFIPVIAVFIFLVSPTFSMYKEVRETKVDYRIKFFDTTFLNLLLARSGIFWFPQEYISAANMVEANSAPQDITYCTLNFLGLTISSIAGRPSANALLPEIKKAEDFNPFASSKIIVFTRIDDAQAVEAAVKRLNLVKVGENKFFLVYKNTACQARAGVVKASVPFGAIICIAALFLFIFWQAARLEGFLDKFIKNI
ncbi:MAG: hypothetical protein PHO03_04685 [Candidatus Omnitrophica bacterium]|nr:hypothetical protein [Candidatus Omnitrophota bacterium]